MNWTSATWSTAASAVAVVVVAVIELRATYGVHRQAQQARPRTWAAATRALADLVYLPSRRVQAPHAVTRVALVSGTVLGLAGGVLGRLLVPQLQISHQAAFRVAGFLLLLAGACIRAASVLALGPAAHREIHANSQIPIVTQGPYRVIRHPAYAGSLLIYAGIGLQLANILSIVGCALVPLLARIPRIYREEQVLISVHGERYLEYAMQVKRLIPGIW